LLLRQVRVPARWSSDRTPYPPPPLAFFEIASTEKSSSQNIGLNDVMPSHDAATARHSITAATNLRGRPLTAVQALPPHGALCPYTRKENMHCRNCNGQFKPGPKANARTAYCCSACRLRAHRSRHMIVSKTAAPTAVQDDRFRPSSAAVAPTPALICSKWEPALLANSITDDLSIPDFLRRTA
jgi:hypothetical protein